MDKTCLSCGKSLVKRAHESTKRFEGKKFCSAICSRIYLKTNKLGWWNPESMKNKFSEL